MQGEGAELGDVFLTSDHPILSDMRQNVRRYGQLTPKQFEFAAKLCSEAYRPELPPKAAELKVPCPTGRQVITGQVVSCKAHEGYYGISMKVTLKVSTPEGAWLVWGTLPASVSADNLVGRVLSLTATVEQGDRDPSFGFFKRPSKAAVL